MRPASGTRNAESALDFEPSSHARESSPPAPVPAHFSELVRLHAQFVWRLLRRLGLSSADAEDGVQTVFLVASRKLQEFAPGKERSFLYSTAVRVAANARRGVRRRAEVNADLEDAVADQALPDELVAAQRARALLDELLARMPDELRRVLVLAEIEQLTVVLIADLEGIPTGTAASRLRRARTKFQELLAEHQASATRRKP